MLWYIMAACVIMHNMIIENERVQDLDYSHYELMGHPMQVGRRAERTARFVASYHAIRRNERHDELQKDLIRGVVDMEWATMIIRSIVCCMFVELFILLFDKLFVFEKFYLFVL